MKLVPFVVSVTALSAALFAADATRTFTGFVHSNQCVGPACATQCPIDKDPVYTLQTEDRAWVLSDAKTAAAYIGKKVQITGTAEGNKLTITSVKSAK
jgi:hypothetical protein